MSPSAVPVTLCIRRKRMFKSGFARIALPLLLSLAALTALGIHARDVSSSIPRIEGGILDLSGRGGEAGRRL
jgi:hypothetical protein